MLTGMRRFLATLTLALLMATTIEAQAGRAILLSGQFNPQYSDTTIYKIAVVSPNIPHVFREYMENKVSEVVQEKGQNVTVIRFTDAVPPFETYTADDVVTRLHEQDVDAVLVIDIRQVGRDSEDPREHIPSSMKEALAFSANHQHRPNYKGKYRPTIVVLYHLATGGVVWRGTGQVNATKDSVKWHKKSSKTVATILATEFANSGITINKTSPKEKSAFEELESAVSGSTE